MFLDGRFLAGVAVGVLAYWLWCQYQSKKKAA